MAVAYLGLGSNKGERISYIQKALAEIEKINETKIIKVSSVYETEPWGNTEQDDYLNSAVEIETGLNAENLLLELKSIEKRLGRSGTKKWSEREIDIDLLFYENEIIVNESMTVPHPQIENRKFVLVPLNQIASDFIHPKLKMSISQLLNKTKDCLEVTKYQKDKINTES